MAKKNKETTMTRDEVRAKLIEIVRRVTGYRGEIGDATRLSEDIGADSLRIIGIVTAAEAAFRTTIQDDALNDLKTVGDAVDYIVRAAAG